ncbi:proton-coupled amino acid transporter 1-like [Limulus polyphemus]|uniref:Proton-coupled amino acid transporter 1-like n=1 Tax=Limulus polyphemus TaxID=6850 RepID=A0ABM1TMZ9_LIMPO|nr:proton-coupled amino acid transporter 1-like [Limulus polyphemus]XP_022257255.1 proton-coupled amino acid transporter 1-like [Limulus polyphemus]XP_022257256.1 proton-coupled amino acid transporter 1-like [Limulus polyphemus]
MSNIQADLKLVEEAATTAIDKLSESIARNVYQQHLGHAPKIKTIPSRIGHEDNRNEPLCTASDSEIYVSKRAAPLEYPMSEGELDNRPLFYDDDDDDEEEETQQPDGSPRKKRPPHKTTNCETLMHLLKGNTGPGILALPSGFSNSGLIVGALGIPLMGLLAIHCMHLLVRCSRHLCKKLGRESLDYSRVALYAFKLGPSPLQKYGRFARRTVNIFLMLTQFGFCCIYFVFVSTNIKQVIYHYTGADLSIYSYLSILLPFVILLVMVRSLRHLALASTVANVFQIMGLCIIFFNLFQNVPPTSSRPFTQPLWKLPLYFGTTIFAFEGIGVILPLENEMQTPQDFGGCSGVLNTGMVIVCCLYVAVGFFGFLKFGESVRGSITLNLPAEPAYELVRVMFAIAVFLSYAIQFYVPLQFIWPFIRKKRRLDEWMSQKTQRMWEYILRAFLVMVTYCLATAIPKLDLFISLVGAVASSSLALVFPCLLEVIVFWNEDMTRGEWIKLFIKNTFIATFGIFGFITGTYASISAIVEAFS